MGTRLEGRYDIDALVAEGGFGVVYRAVHLRLKKPVALKVLKLKGLESERERPTVIALFEAEAETAARLDHPAIVKVLDFGVSPMPDGTEAPWMALDWVDGVALADDLRARRDTPGRTPAEVLALMRPVLSGLAKAHAMGVAHRDLKPRNLMLTARGEGGSWGPDDVPVKILDFGIAKEMSGDESVPASGDTSTRSLTVAFSLRYAAPEQVSATRTGPWTDVYQMGLVITELLANKSPYRGDDTMDVHMQIMASSRPTPARLGVDVGAWEAVLAKALKLRPAERYATVAEFLAAVTGRGAGTVSLCAALARDGEAAAHLPLRRFRCGATRSQRRSRGGLTAPPIPPTEPVVAEQTVAAPPPRGARARRARWSPLRSSRCSPRSPPPSPCCGVRPLLRRRGTHAPWWSPRGSSPSSMPERMRRPRRPPWGAHRHATAPSVRDERAAAAPRLRRQVTRRLSHRRAAEPPRPRHGVRR